MIHPRVFIACGRYEGREEFYFGNVVALGFEEARQKLEALWGTISPHPAPDFYVVPGQVFLEID